MRELPKGRRWPAARFLSIYSSSSSTFTSPPTSPRFNCKATFRTQNWVRERSRAVCRGDVSQLKCRFDSGYDVSKSPLDDACFHSHRLEADLAAYDMADLRPQTIEMETIRGQVDPRCVGVRSPAPAFVCADMIRRAGELMPGPQQAGTRSSSSSSTSEEAEADYEGDDEVEVVEKYDGGEETEVRGRKRKMQDDNNDVPAKRDDGWRIDAEALFDEEPDIVEARVLGEIIQELRQNIRTYRWSMCKSAREGKMEFCAWLTRLCEREEEREKVAVERLLQVVQRIKDEAERVERRREAA